MSNETGTKVDSVATAASASAPLVGVVKPVSSPSVTSDPSGSSPASSVAVAASSATKATAATPAQAVTLPLREQSRAPMFTQALFRIVMGLLGAQLLLLGGNLWFQFRNYASGIRLAEQAGATADIVSLVLIYSRAWDFAVTKTSALFLGFMVVYLGALYVLRSADSAYELTVSQGPQPSVSLRSSSPGLLMVLLGALLVALVLSSRSEVGVQVDPSDSVNGVANSKATGSAGSGSPSSAPIPSSGTPRPTTAPASGTAPAVARPAAVTAPAAASVEDHRMPKLLDP